MAITIVSILAVIAVPFYMNFDVRAEISEGFSVAAPAKNAVIEYYQTNGSWPTSNADVFLNAPASYRTKYVDSITVSGNLTGATITIAYSIPTLGSNNTIILAASSNPANSILWTCNGGSLIKKYRPASCQS